MSNDTNATNTAANTEVKTPLTKAERIEKLEGQIAKLRERLSDVINDVVRAPAAKVVVLPAVGQDVRFTYGRKTATSNPVELVGTVVAVKPASTNEEGRSSPAQLKVSTGEGFDAAFVVIYPAQVVEIIEAIAQPQIEQTVSGF